MLRIEDAERMQGLPEGWTRSCFPVSSEGIGSHKRNSWKENDIDTHTSRRWQLLGNAVTVQVARWLGERLMNPYAYKYRVSGGLYSVDDLVCECKPKFNRGVLSKYVVSVIRPKCPCWVHFHL